METKIGLVTYIEIHCETEEQIIIHLNIIRNEVMKRIKSGNIISEFEDSNCYGEHTCTISEDVTGVAI